MQIFNKIFDSMHKNKKILHIMHKRCIIMRNQGEEKKYGKK